RRAAGDVDRAKQPCDTHAASGSASGWSAAASWRVAVRGPADAGGRCPRELGLFAVPAFSPHAARLLPALRRGTRLFAAHCDCSGPAGRGGSTLSAAAIAVLLAAKRVAPGARNSGADAQLCTWLSARLPHGRDYLIAKFCHREPFTGPMVCFLGHRSAVPREKAREPDGPAAACKAA